MKGWKRGLRGGIGKYFLNREETKWVYALTDGKGKSFLDNRPKSDAYTMQRIVTTIGRVFDRGVAWAKESGTIKQLKGVSCNVAVFETKVKGGVVRIATYLHMGNIPIYLFDFNTHSGSRNNIPRHYLDRASEAAEVAAQCAQEYDFSEYEEHRK